MTATVLRILLAPALVAFATLAARRYGARVAGVVSAVPAIVGPVLLLGVEQHGRDFAAREATGTLLGLVALSAFAAAYGRASRAAGPAPALAVGWAAASLSASAVAGVHASPAVALGAACVSFVLASASLGRGAGEPLAVTRAAAADHLALRMASTAALVVALALGGARLGATAAGVLTALPVLATVLVLSTHRAGGGAEARDLLRGMLHGMAGFAAFCFVVATLLPHRPVGATFATATGVAMAAALVAAWLEQARGQGPRRSARAARRRSTPSRIVSPTAPAASATSRP